MAYYKVQNLIKFAKMVGIDTLGELAIYKRNKGIKNNEELYFSLYYLALMQRNIKRRLKGA